MDEDYVILDIQEGESGMQLPELKVDGIPMTIDSMSLADVRTFIPDMMKYSSGRSAPLWGQPAHKPPWWPIDIPWANIKTDVRSAEMKQKVKWTDALKSIIISCYKHHGEEYLLYRKPQQSKYLESSEDATEDMETVFFEENSGDPPQQEPAQESTPPLRKKVKAEFFGDRVRLMEFVCQRCSCKFKHQDTLLEHFAKAHGKTGLFKCLYEGCDFAGDFKKQLNKHVRTEHVKIDAPHRTSLQVLDDMEATSHNQADETENVTDIEGPQETGSETVKRGAHADEEALVCKQCSLSFRRRNQLYDHFSKIHGQKGLYPCPFQTCDYVGDLNGNLTKHLWKHSQKVRNSGKSATGTSDADKTGDGECEEPMDQQEDSVKEAKKHDLVVITSEHTYALGTEQQSDVADNPIQITIIQPEDLSEDIDQNKDDSQQTLVAQNENSQSPDKRREEDTGEAAYNCEICEQGFHNNSAYLDHKALEHNVRGLFQCCFATCMYVGSRYSQYVDHLRKTHGCVEFDSNSNAAETTATRLPDNQQSGQEDVKTTMLRCDLCSSDHKSLRHLLDHYAEYHAKQGLFQCPYDGCNTVADRYHILRNHIWKHSKNQLKGYTAVMSKEEVQERLDELMSDTLNTIHEIDDSVNAAQNDEADNAEAPDCDQAKADFDMKCKYCKQRFTRYNKLADHYFVDHAITGLYICPYPRCEYVADIHDRFRGHLRRHRTGFSERYQKYVAPGDELLSESEIQKAWHEKIISKIRKLEVVGDENEDELSDEEYTKKAKRETELKYSIQSAAFCCHLCPLRFKTMRMLLDHYAELHRFPAEFPCPHDGCGHISTRYKHLRSHLWKHNNNQIKGFNEKMPLDIAWNKLETVLCSMWLPVKDASEGDNESSESRDGTIKAEINQEETQFFMELDDTNDALSEEGENEAGDNPVMYPCTICSRRFPRRLLLLEHYGSRHGKSDLFPCPYSDCEYTGERMQPLLQHLIRHKHGLATKHLSREERDAEYVKAKLGLEGMFKKTLSSIKPVCELKSRKDTYINIDMNLTRDALAYHCKYCGEGTDHMGYLLDHYACEHDLEKLFPCPYPTCEYRGDRYLNMRAHLRKHRLGYIKESSNLGEVERKQAAIEANETLQSIFRDMLNSIPDIDAKSVSQGPSVTTHTTTVDGVEYNIVYEDSQEGHPLDAGEDSNSQFVQQATDTAEFVKLLPDHIRKRMTCKICGEFYSRGHLLLDHYAVDHEKKGLFHCPFKICNYSVNRYQALQKHMSCHKKKLNDQDYQSARKKIRELTAKAINKVLDSISASLSNDDIGTQYQKHSASQSKMVTFQETMDTVPHSTTFDDTMGQDAFDESTGAAQVSEVPEEDYIECLYPSDEEQMGNSVEAQRCQCEPRTEHVIKIETGAAKGYRKSTKGASRQPETIKHISITSYMHSISGQKRGRSGCSYKDCPKKRDKVNGVKEPGKLQTGRNIYKCAQCTYTCVEQSIIAEHIIAKHTPAH